MKNENNKLVVGYYVNAAAAETAAEDLKAWDKADDAIKLGAIAVLTINPKTGELEANDMGQRNTRSGALWGTAIGAVVGILSGGIGFIPGLLLGAGGGAAFGAMSHKTVGMSDEEHAEMVERLRNGGAALAVMADDYEVEPLKAEMAEIGGYVKDYDVPEETASVVTAAAEVQAGATAAIDAAVASVSEAADEATDAVRSAVIELPDLAPETAAAVSGLALASQLDPVAAAKLHGAGIDKASALLERGATPHGRDELAEATGLDGDTILVAVKKLDLMRVKGVGVKYAALLLASGVETVPDLARRNALNLHEALANTNAAENLVAELPSENEVTAWVDRAKDLPRVVFYS
jgi:uncharacterized membrane protein